MNQEKTKVHFGVPLVVLLVIVISFFYGWEIEAQFKPDRVARNIAELSGKVSKELDAGKTSGSFLVTGISEKEIEKINDLVCSVNGTVVQYSMMKAGMGGMRLNLFYEISDNYYVYKKYKGEEEIPSDRPQAVKLYQKTNEILNSIVTSNMTDYEIELAIHDYIVTHCEYGYTEYSPNSAYRAYGVLVQGMGVCNGYAEAMALLLSCVGIENEIITGYAGDELHAWNLVKVNNDWYQVDATWDDPVPDRGDFSGHAYFNITDDLMDDDHTWQKKDYRVCESNRENYFRKKQLICDVTTLEPVMSNLIMNSAAISGKRKIFEVVVNNYNGDENTLLFLTRIGGISKVSYATQPYGDSTLLTIYAN